MIYVLGLFIVSIILNCLLAGNNIADSAIDILKIFAIINISILLIQDINIMELVAFLSKIRIPTKIAIALGVGIRYFSLLTYDVKRINFVQSINGYGFNMRKIKKNGFIKTISIFLTPLFLNILKRTENISISVSIQNVENRAKGFQFKRTTIPEYMVLTISLAVLLYGIYSSLFH
jgi:energy-coupling factor transporter transmembrane protein EcfT